jgi:hypothetical protein
VKNEAGKQGLASVVHADNHPHTLSDAKQQYTDVTLALSATITMPTSAKRPSASVLKHGAKLYQHNLAAFWADNASAEFGK